MLTRMSHKPSQSAHINPTFYAIPSDPCISTRKPGHIWSHSHPLTIAPPQDGDHLGKPAEKPFSASFHARTFDESAGAWRPPGPAKCVGRSRPVMRRTSSSVSPSRAARPLCTSAGTGPSQGRLDHPSPLVLGPVDQVQGKAG